MNQSARDEFLDGVALVSAWQGPSLRHQVFGSSVDDKPSPVVCKRVARELASIVSDPIAISVNGPIIQKINESKAAAALANGE